MWETITRQSRHLLIDWLIDQIDLARFYLFPFLQLTRAITITVNNNILVDPRRSSDLLAILQAHFEAQSLTVVINAIASNVSAVFPVQQLFEDAAVSG